MLDAKDKLSDGALFIAEKQSFGQCRKQQRRWISYSQDLTFTLSLKIKESMPITVFPLLVSLAIIKFLHKQHITCYIKWPNDILVDEKKISGILCQIQQEYLLIGVGFNIKKRKIKNYLFSAIGLNNIISQIPSKEVILNSILYNLYHIMNNDLWVNLYNRWLYKPSTLITYQNGNNIYTGQILCVEENGCLNFRLVEGTIIQLHAGESIRR